MREHEAEQVIGALETGRRFEFSNYHPGVREVLQYEAAAGRFVHTTHYAYEPDRDEKSVFTREGFAAYLRHNFSYQSFDLPPSMRLCPPRRARIGRRSWRPRGR
jgi:hypothetical protein